MNESYSDTWDAERAYNKLKRFILRTQAKENPTSCMVLTTQEHARMSLCANGSMPVELFEQALEQLEKHEGVVVGDIFLSYPPNLKSLNTAREFVIDYEKLDKQFIASSNKVQQSGVFEE